MGRVLTRFAPETMQLLFAVTRPWLQTRPVTRIEHESREHKSTLTTLSSLKLATSRWCARARLGLPQSRAQCTTPRRQQATSLYSLRQVRSSVRVPLAMQAGDSPPKPFILFSWLAYVAIVLCSDALPGSSVFRANYQVVKEAAELSLNFWLILPLLRPEQAPVLHPLLESTFQIVVSWAMLFFGFLSDDWGRHWRKRGHRRCRQPQPMWMFLLGSALLTNVFYLPYLVIRRPWTSVTGSTNQASPKGVLSEQNEQKDETTAQSSAPDWLLRVGESRALPLLLSTTVLAAVLWALGGRPTYPAAPPLSTDRLATYVHDILQKDRLAVSFPIDMLVFAIFQAALVPDDMRRRGIDPQSTQGKRWIHRARWIPFFGVAWYMWSRPRLPGWPES